MMPLSVLPMMASSEYSTIAAMRWTSLPVCACSVTSLTPVIQQDVHGVDVAQADVGWDLAVRLGGNHVLRVHPHQRTGHSLRQDLDLRHVREHLIPLSNFTVNSKQTKQDH